MNAACYCFLLLAQKIANMRIFRSERPNTYAIQRARIQICRFDDYE